jgi:hypothetical protein
VFGDTRPTRARPLAAARPRSSETLHRSAAQIRESLAAELAPAHLAELLGSAFDIWRNRASAVRAPAVGRIARNLGFSRALLEESIDALVRPFTRRALDALAARVGRVREVFGFIMPGNVPGAGMHELVLALSAGGGALVKAASAEPCFFAAFAATLSEIAPEVGARLGVFTWERTRADLNQGLAEATDRVVAFGDDRTIDAIRTRGTVIGFASRLSGAFIGRDALSEERLGPVASALARDVTLFEQQGCLSPHHVFVEGESAEAASMFASRLADALGEFARRLPPPRRLGIEAGAAIRREREIARWRAIGGEDVTLWEGRALGWTVIFDAGAPCAASPGYRTVRVSAVRSLAELAERLEPARGRLEAFALSEPSDAAAAGLVRALGVTYVCPLGEMQSPPLDWPHGGGAMLDAVGLRR